MTVEVSLRAIERSLDGDNLNIEVDVFQRGGMSFKLTFKVPKMESLDQAVQEAQRQLERFAGEVYSAVNQNPLTRSLTRQL
jgi:hypothetical protein